MSIWRTIGKGPDESGQAMLEVILLVALVGLVVGFAFRTVADGFGTRKVDLETYYSLPVP